MSAAPAATGDVSAIRRRLSDGLVIPAHPLALTSDRRLDEDRQRALTRYYVAAGAGGLAVGVHTTQFAIREAGLYRAVLELAAEASRESPATPLLVAGIMGDTPQAVAEAEAAASLGYEVGLLSLSALPTAEESLLIDHCRAVATIIPLFGFYLQPAVGGRILDHEFWCRFVEIDDVVAIKVAPFNRYQTLDVVRAVGESRRTGEIALYTGNDDAIIVDLLAEYRVGDETLQFTGGLLGQWAVGTRKAVELLGEVKRWRSERRIPPEAMILAGELTDTNAALFDSRNAFAGCIPGIHEVLRRQGLLTGNWCLDPEERLSLGQLNEIDRVCQAYPHLHDDDFVAAHLDEWLR